MRSTTNWINDIWISDIVWTNDRPTDLAWTLLHNTDVLLPRHNTGRLLYHIYMVCVCTCVCRRVDSLHTSGVPSGRPGAAVWSYGGQ